MAQKLQYQNHVSNPAAQPFSVGARPNKTKKNSWWSSSSKNFWRLAKKTKTDKK